MRHLLLLRHAQAQGAPPGAGDLDRTLTERGRLEAREAALCIARVPVLIDAILVSPSLRTRETASIVAAELNLSVPVDHEPTLYLGTPDALRRSLNGCRARAQTVLLVAHNPGISDLAHELSGGTLTVVLKTAGVCHMTFMQSTWNDLEIATTSEVLR
jgi:phosphohistidine phosphatase